MECQVKGRKDQLTEGIKNIVFICLIHRGYSGRKLEDNIQCEIFQTILEEASNSYLPSIVRELPSNTPDDMEENISTIEDHIRQWKASKR